MPTIIDYSQPLSDILRESTKEVHQQLETSEGAKALLSGKLPKEDYILYLMLLWRVYDTLERNLERYATHPALEPTYNPALLARAPAIFDDISYLSQTTSWQSSELFKELTSSPPTALDDYVSRIQEVADKDPARLLSHAYVRYLGDMSGGQNIRRIMAKAYDLDEREGLGLKFYDFKELNGTNTAGLGELRRTKDWFRAGMNAGAGDDVERKEAIGDEAAKAFLLNAGIFDFLATDPQEGEEHAYSEPVLAKGEGWRVFSMTSFAAVLLALCIAHFTLVVGGFTGSRGYQKLLSIQGWLTTVWPSAESVLHKST